LLILPETSAAQAGLLAEELCAVLAEAPCVTAAGEQIPIRASFGIAACPEDATHPDGLIALAEADVHASRQRAGDREEWRPRDAEDEAASRPRVEAGVSAVTAGRQGRADKVATEKLAADEPAAPPQFRAWDGGTIDQAEMRSRIEETRTRLKVKAFDAMIRGESVLLARDDGEAPGTAGDDPTLDSDLEGMVDGAFSEQDY
jgi:hypothetical protein